MSGVAQASGSTSYPTSSIPTIKASTKGKAKPIPTPIEAFDNPDQGEERTVHEIYERIAPHFAQTRYKPWPLITSFLNSLPPNSVGLDSGAGNGKYLPTAHEAGHVMIALDRSMGLLELAKAQSVFSDPGGEHGERGGMGEVVRGDLGCRGWRDGVFDFTISVAAVHHLSTPLRRRQAVQAILPPLKLNQKGPYSRFFIYVWAYEQGELSKRAMGSASTSTPGVGEGAGAVDETDPKSSTGDGIVQGAEEKVQDVLVPWVLKGPTSTQTKPKPKIKSKSRKQKKNPIGAEEVELQTSEPEPEAEAEAGKEGGEGEGDKVYHRYYHLFVQGELRDLVLNAGKEEGYRILEDDTAESKPDIDSDLDNLSNDEGKWLRIRGEGWEADNWWLEAEVGVGPYIPGHEHEHER